MITGTTALCRVRVITESKHSCSWCGRSLPAIPTVRPDSLLGQLISCKGLWLLLVHVASTSIRQSWNSITGRCGQTRCDNTSNSNKPATNGARTRRLDGNPLGRGALEAKLRHAHPHPRAMVVPTPKPHCASY